MFSYIRNLLRLFTVGGIILISAGAVVLGLLTVGNLYRGERDVLAEHRQDGIAHVDDCRRVGPVSGYGFGYWWECDATVSFADGRTIDALVGASKLTPNEPGPVEVVETCTNRSRTSCEYARPGSWLPGVGVGLLGLVEFAVLVLGLLGSGGFFVRGLLGERLSRVLLTKHTPGQTGLPSEPAAWEEKPSGTQAATAPGEGVLRVVVERPADIPEEFATRGLMRLSVDRDEQRQLDWGIQEFVVASGDRRLEASVHLDKFEFGRAAREVAVPDGEIVTVVYCLPDSPRAPGVLRVGSERPAEQWTSDLSPARMLVATLILYAPFGLLLLVLD